MNTVLKGGQKVKADDAITDTLSDTFKDNLTISIRQAPCHVSISKASVQRVVKKKLKLYPYKVQLMQSLKPANYVKREEFAEH